MTTHEEPKQCPYCQHVWKSTIEKVIEQCPSCGRWVLRYAEWEGD